MNDQLGDRMKAFYEDRFRYKLPCRTHTIIRIDGKAFHSYTKGLVKPFDDQLISDMNETAKYLCENISGAKFAYVQSDEISIIITDFDQLNTQAWFDNNLQKMCSVSASLATEKFNKLRLVNELKKFYFMNNQENIVDDIVDTAEKFKTASFDSRVFQISYIHEVINYFLWRQQDAIRNSVISVAQARYSTKELDKKKVKDMLVMLKNDNDDWNDYPLGRKQGRLIIKENVIINPGTEKETNRRKWVIKDAPNFLEEKQLFIDTIHNTL